MPIALGGGGLGGLKPVKLGARPTGSPLVVGSKLYVPVTRGIAVVNLETGKALPAIALPATPVALAAGPGNRSTRRSSPRAGGRRRSGKKAVLVAAGKGPVALAIAGGNVYVVNAARARCGVSTARAGAPGPAPRSPGSAAAAHPREDAEDLGAGRTVTVTVPLAGGTLAANQLAVVDRKIAGGHAQVLLGRAASARGATKSAQGVAVKTSTGPGRVQLTLGAKAGDFTKLAVARSAGGHSVVFTLTQKPAPPPVTTTTPQVTTTHDDTDVHDAATTTPTTTTPPVTHTTPPQTTTKPQRPTPPPPPKTTTQTFTVSQKLGPK